LLSYQKVSAVPLPGKRFDCGSKLGYLEAILAYGTEHPDLKKDFHQLLKQYLENA